MAGENGATSSPTEYGTFTIGGEVVKVPAATLYLLEVLKDDFDALGPNQSTRDYAKTCIRIISFMLDEGDWENLSQKLWKKLTFKELPQLLVSMNEYLILSGLIEPGEAQAAVDPAAENPGTGMSEPSPPSLPFTEFAEVTSTGSSEVTH